MSACRTLFIQGMRRSGTTIAFDALTQDPGATGIYEPLAAARRPAVGGGSGATKIDYFAPVREGRERFVREHPEFTFSDFNYGAPRKPELEFEPRLPPHCIDYLRALLPREGSALYKFTRMSHKIGDLRKIDDDGLLIVVVRDPRAVATSYLYGKSQRHASEFSDSQLFFTRASDYSAWKSLEFSNSLMRYQPGLWPHDQCPDFARVLMIWADNLRATLAGANEHFPERWFLWRHDDFARDPEAVLAAYEKQLSVSVSPQVISWAKQGVRARADIHQPDAGEWRAALSDLGALELAEELRLLR